MTRRRLWHVLLTDTQLCLLDPYCAGSLRALVYAAVCRIVEREPSPGTHALLSAREMSYLRGKCKGSLPQPCGETLVALVRAARKSRVTKTCEAAEKPAAAPTPEPAVATSPCSSSLDASPTPARVAEVAEEYRREPMSMTEAGILLGVSPKMAGRLLRRSGVHVLSGDELRTRHRPPPPEDRARADSKLSFSQVGELLKCYAESPCYAAVAAKFGVSGQAVKYHVKQAERRAREAEDEQLALLP